MTDVMILGSNFKSSLSIEELTQKIKEDCLPEGILIICDSVPQEQRVPILEFISSIDLPAYCEEEPELKNERPFAPVPPWHRSYKTNKKRLKR